MATHFFKTLVIFAGMIVLGLLGVFLASYFDQGTKGPVDASVEAE